MDFISTYTEVQFLNQMCGPYANDVDDCFGMCNITLPRKLM
jgi:hypothetical protein